MLFPPVIVSILSLLGMIALLFTTKTDGELFSCLAGCFVGCCLQLKLRVVLIEHWIAEIDFASIDFAWDDTLLMVHSLCGGGLEVVLGHVHNALGNKFDEDFAVLAHMIDNFLLAWCPVFFLGFFDAFLNFGTHFRCMFGPFAMNNAIDIFRF